jgi:hypothetical protein
MPLSTVTTSSKTGEVPSPAKSRTARTWSANGGISRTMNAPTMNTRERPTPTRIGWSTGRAALLASIPTRPRWSGPEA